MRLSEEAKNLNMILNNPSKDFNGIKTDLNVPASWCADDSDAMVVMKLQRQAGSRPERISVKSHLKQSITLYK